MDKKELLLPNFSYVGASSGEREREAKPTRQSERGKGPPEPLFEIFELQTEGQLPGRQDWTRLPGRGTLLSHRALYRSLLFNLYCQTASAAIVLLLLQMMERRRSRIRLAVALFDG